MIGSTDAAQYGAGLLAATPAADASAIADALDSVATAIHAHAELAATLKNPAIPAAIKAQLMTNIVAAGGGSALLQRFVTLVVEHGHASDLTAIAAAYRSKLDEKNGVVEARVRLAVAASDSEIASIADALGKATGRTVRVHAEVDPSLIGGFVARVGDLIFDGSIARQLERLGSSFRGIA